MTFRTVYNRTQSANGWRNVNRDGCVVANPVPFSNTAPVRRGVAATILNAWLIYYHRNIEPISTPVWGWSVVNDVASSNHLSGTAFDIHAPKYPFRRRSMPADIRAKVEAGLRLFEGTVAWGGYWTNPVDEMHYELAFREGDPRNDAFAAKLSAGHLGIYSGNSDAVPAPAPEPPVTSRPTLQSGSRGADVSYLQALFNRAYPAYSKIAVDGDFGPATEAVTREFQRRSNIAADGIVGPATWRALGVK
ncbi:peptidoglycan-binding protein [Peribacillus butanolivorans]|uniref:peptidoglycan-binding protein n=1 Tax=Peribacillus butanolivorans TaxID=421767 RepID=UPI003659007E